MAQGPFASFHEKGRLCAVRKQREESTFQHAGGTKAGAMGQTSHPPGAESSDPRHGGGLCVTTDDADIWWPR